VQDKQASYKLWPEVPGSVKRQTQESPRATTPTIRLNAGALWLVGWLWFCFSFQLSLLLLPCYTLICMCEALTRAGGAWLVELCHGYRGSRREKFFL
jgi:hypothetical protein